MTSGVVGAQSGNDLFQQALVKERAEGNLAEAIALYEKIVRQHGSDRKLAAKALYQIGQANERLGLAEARKVYERISREFADQKDVAADAGRRLAMLTGGVANSGRPTNSLVRKGNKVDVSGSVSADGRYLSSVDWGTSDVALVLHDVARGQDRRLVAAEKYKPGKKSDFPEESVISRDGTQVAYSWLERSKGRYDLRVVNLTGEHNPRVLYDHPNVEWMEPRDWSTDGKWIAVLIVLKEDSDRRGGLDRLGLISVADGSFRVLRSGNWPGNTRIFFSPDGKYLGYDLPQRDAKRRDVWVSAIDGSGDTPAVVHPGDDRMMGWSPDGKRLLFRSDRTASMALWSLPFSNGRPLGAPEMLKPDIGEAESLGVTQSGALYYGIRTARTRGGSIQIGSFDFRSGEVTSAREVTDDYLEENSNPCWSPDGKYLAYVSARDRAKKVIVIRSAETNRVVRELPHTLVNPPGGLAGWEPNGRALLLAGEDLETRKGVFRLNVDTGDMELLFKAQPKTGPVWSPDGRSIYYHRGNEYDRDQVLLQRDIVSGAEREVIRRWVLSAISLSPDGNYLVTGTFDSSKNEQLLLLVPLRGGEPREMLRAPGNTLVDVSFWAVDSRSFIARKRLAAGSEAELWEIPADGGSPRKLDSLLDKNVYKFTLSPDGKTVAFRKEEQPAIGRSKEIWVLENFLPAIK